MKLDELKNKMETYQIKRDGLLSTINSLKGQKSLLDSQKTELIKELKTLGFNSSKELEQKIDSLSKELKEFEVEIPDDLLCDLI